MAEGSLIGSVISGPADEQEAEVEAQREPSEVNARVRNPGGRYDREHKSKDQKYLRPHARIVAQIEFEKNHTPGT